MQRGRQSSRTDVWDTRSFNGGEQYDAWVHLLNETYGSWDVPRGGGKAYSASLKMTRFGDVGIAQCICDPCSGKRDQHHISRDEAELVVIQLTRSGRECVRFRDQDHVLGPGDIMIWDSTKTMRFRVEERLDKVSLLLPLSRLQSWMPHGWHDVPRKIAADSPDAILLRSYMTALTSEALCESGVNGNHLSEAALAMLAGSVSPRGENRDNSLRAAQLARIKAFIDQHLDDSELTLAKIAEASGISLRYLHWLFQSTGETVTRYIQRLRLANCRRDLESPLLKGCRIADIAQTWGFSDPMHFSRVFKEMYGVRPSDVRNGAAKSENNA